MTARKSLALLSASPAQRNRYGPLGLAGVLPQPQAISKTAISARRMRCRFFGGEVFRGGRDQLIASARFAQLDVRDRETFGCGAPYQPRCPFLHKHRLSKIGH